MNRSTPITSRLLINKRLLSLAANILLCAGLLLPTTHSAVAEEQFLDRIVAVVGKDIIMLSELRRRTEAIKQQLIARNTRLPDDKTLAKQVLDKLIGDQLQIARAEENGIRVTDQALDRTMEKIAKSNALTLAQFKQQLEAEGQVYREVRNQIRTEMIITQVRERIVNSRIKVSDQEIKNFLASEQGQQKTQSELHLAHIMIPIPSSPTADQLIAAKRVADKTYKSLEAGADFAETSIAVSSSPRALEGGDLGWRKQSELPEAIRNALKNVEKGQLTQPFRMGGAFQIVKVVDSRGGSVRMVDQARVRHILISSNQIRNDKESEEFIRSLRKRIIDGEDFAQLAKEHSDDSGSGSLGGDLGWTLPGQMVPVFENVMNDTPIGSISPVFKSQFGWHILQVLERKQEDLGERILANEARETIRKRKFTEELANWLREIKSQAYIEIKL
ncbi:peptidylprolyl isomerase [Motiliproteus sp. MSK22-1]|uniref:peptidylprolyl isomerase n=1 Tax=Motiliproteus sp. MSK22-1 TaxID=1897630 RepID=UPI000975AFCA|nr:peptidylprolyl isomerase [Motiliproteus sp. MSK22-1]OMH32158.1 hypothetical protein BGP75_15795 [Motiliproteus sp. MSK22-1]